jgi:hypothetical protein
VEPTSKPNLPGPVRDLLLGTLALAVCFAGLCAYAAYQRDGLNRSGRVTDGTRIAESALEGLKGQLADSLRFRSEYAKTASGPSSSIEVRTVNKTPYTVSVTLVRAPDTAYALRVQARVTWQSTHGVELGALVPGDFGSL